MFSNPNIPMRGACSYRNCIWFAIYLGKGMKEDKTKGISLCAFKNDLVPLAKNPLSAPSKDD